MKLTSRFIVLLISILMVMSSTIAVFADTAGNAGNVRAGATTNTFAQNMDLQTIYLDYDILHTVQTATNVTGEGLSVDGGGVILSGDKLPATGTTNFTGYSWDYVYPSAATYPDGTKGDVTLHCVLNTIYTASLDAKNKDGNLIPADTDPMPNFEGTVGVWGETGANHASARVSGDGNFRSEKCYVTATISVSRSDTYTSGTYILPISGDNAYKGDGQAWKSLKLYDPLKDDPRIRKEEAKPSGEVYRAENCELMTYEDGTLAGGELNKSGVDDSYTYGFATEGSSAGTNLVFGLTAGYAKSSQNNTIKLQLGDLQHRIWSGSGEHGKIETSKDGTTGTGLDGGSFTGDIPSGMPATNTDEQKLMRYVVPDAKENVTYIMQPTTDGYFAKEVSVDGETQKIKMDQPTGWTLDFKAGTLTHLGGDKYSFVFKEPNAADHSIYVTWRTTPAGDDATSIDGKGQTQTGQPKFKPGGAPFLTTGGYKLMDGTNPVDEITVPREGKYRINPDTGVVTFYPEPDFVGTAKGVTVQATDEDGNKPTAEYIPTVVETDQTKTVTRKVTFTYKTENGKTASKTVTQTLTFKRTGKYNKETGQVDYPDWEPQTFPAVKAPKIKGWTPNMAEAPALTVLDPNIEVADVHIVYNEVEGDEAGEGVDTGDDNNVKPWVAILLANAMAICALIISRRRRNA